MSKEKRKHKNKGTTGTTACNTTGYKIVNVVTLQQIHGYYKVTTACYIYCV